MSEQESKLDFNLEEIEKLETYSRVKEQNRRYSTIILALTVLNILVKVFYPGVENDSFSLGYRTGEALTQYVFVLPFISFVLGLLSALLPHKKLSYGKRYLNSSIWILMILDVIFLLVTLLSTFA